MSCLNAVLVGPARKANHGGERQNLGIVTLIIHRPEHYQRCHHHWHRSASRGKIKHFHQNKCPLLKLGGAGCTFTNSQETFWSGAPILLWYGSCEDFLPKRPYPQLEIWVPVGPTPFPPILWFENSHFWQKCLSSRPINYRDRTGQVKSKNVRGRAGQNET